MALTANRVTKMLGNSPKPTILSIPIADNAHIYEGSLVGIDAAGNAIPASTSAVKVIGRAEAEADNTVTGHVVAAFDVRVRQGCFAWALGAGVDALTAADEGFPCYASDDQTINRTSANGTRPYAGTVIVDPVSGALYAQTYLGQTDDQSLITLIAADNFVGKPNLAVTVFNSSGVPQAKTAIAGDPAIGCLINTPLAGAIARVRVLGPTAAFASGSINPGVLVAADANGQVKAASALAVSGAAANGSYVLGVALTAGSLNNSFQILLKSFGEKPTNGV